MQHTPIFEQGRFIGSFICAGNKTKKPTLKQTIERRKRAERDARLVQIFTR